MATTLPRPRASNSTSSSTLPVLPVAKTRKSTGGLATPASPRSGLRAPSANAYSGPPPSPAPTTALPVPRSSHGVNSAGKTIRKTVSINSFPQPPSRTATYPSSPLSGSITPARKARTPQPTSKLASAPSLLNGGSDGKSLLGGASARHSDGFISVSSPPQSRSSSAQDSYSTSATTYDDPADGAGTSVGDKHTSKGMEGKGNVLVSVRVRPDAGGNGNNKPEGEWMVDGRRSLIAYRGREGGDYFYDNVFTTHDDNSRVYDHLAKRLVRRVMEGYHGTVFAYGMTGTGKTFSMQGTASSPGVIPLAITDIFSYIRETPSREFLLRVSYLEIYNERIHDLLSMASGAAAQEEIKLREDSKRGVYATPLKEEIVQSPTQLLRVIARGDQARRTASTQFNARSSRSHAVVQIVVESRERIPGGGDNKRSGILPGGVRVSTLSLIDLAGSEKAAETKERRAEGSHINKSLLTLGTVISKLSENKEAKGGDKDAKHLPYRDSKLTRLLQGALSGNSLVSILCTIQTGAANSAASANSHATETLNTLKFASRAKNSIVSHAKRAEEALGAGGEGGARVLLERYRMEIQELRSQLETQAKSGNSKIEDNEDKVKDEEEERVREKEAEARHEEQMLEMQLARTALKERIDHLNRLILSSKSTGVNAGGTYSSLGMHSRFSQASLRTSIATSNGSHSLLERPGSMGSSASTIGQRSIRKRRSSIGEQASNDDEDSLGEYGDGTASLQAQNQALRADLADKNRYIATLEKRLLQARRASSSRTSSGFSAPHKGIMVGEDHSVSTLMKEKDAEIAELRARLEDKDRMLSALRSAARSRDVAEAIDTSRSETRSSLLYEQAASPPPQGALPDPPVSVSKGQSPIRKRTRSVDEMSRILDEMIQDRVEAGHIVRGVRGSVQVVNDGKGGTVAEPDNTELEPLRQSSTSIFNESKQVVLEA
ncbi:kinesin-domain-containing protein [Daldinia vernicosa]|uniref:kinesin-domain-containing protein n=1 Tax=Daldinia vernicosa TaxID=114800 RepID=UPI002007F528|nr:kinesin-domain-containing protein [Daldinia vernicosa]KAI0848879.1 kinesin-domain-containing protein [Daldinia vernicosa]